MVFETEIDPFLLRIDLIRSSQTNFDKTSDRMGRLPLASRPLGCYIGNGIAIDSNGNIYLDPIKFFKADLGANFAISGKNGKLIHSNNVFTISGMRDGAYFKETAQLEDNVYRVRSSFANVRTVAYNPTTKAGLNMTSILKEKLKYTPTSISIATDLGKLAGTQSFNREGEKTVVYAGNNYRIEITQNGDAFSVKSTETAQFIPQTTNYAINLLSGRLIVRKGNTVTVDIDIAANEIKDHRIKSVLLSFLPQ
jgi:hypothetical protein